MRSPPTLPAIIFTLFTPNLSYFRSTYRLNQSILTPIILKYIFQNLKIINLNTYAILYTYLSC